MAKYRVTVKYGNPGEYKHNSQTFTVTDNTKTIKNSNNSNVEVTGAARLYRAASVWTAGLGFSSAE